MTIGEYERVRADSNSFVAAPGHDVPDVDEIVREETAYTVVSKLGAGAPVADASDQAIAFGVTPASALRPSRPRAARGVARRRGGRRLPRRRATRTSGPARVRARGRLHARRRRSGRRDHRLGAGPGRPGRTAAARLCARVLRPGAPAWLEGLCSYLP